MIWLRRLFLLPCLAGITLVLGYFFGYQALTSADLATGALLALAAGVALFIALRLFAAVALGLSMMLGFLLLIGIILSAGYFLLENEQDRWFNNQDELPVQVPQADRKRQYFSAIGLEPNPAPPVDWWQHAKHQANTGLATQQLGPNQVGKPVPTLGPNEVWSKWLADLMMLALALLGGIWFGSTKRKRSR